MLLLRDPGERRCEAWAREHKALLGLVFARFLSTGEWPNAEALQRDLARRRDERDLLAEVRSLPPRLGCVDEAGRVTLTVCALATVDAARDLLGDYLTIVELGVARYGGPGETILGPEEYAPALGHSLPRAARVTALIASDAWLFEPDGVVLAIAPEIRHFAGARSIRSYLEIEREIRKPPKVRRRVRSWLAGRGVTLGEGILVSVVGSLIVIGVAAGFGALF